MAFNDCVHMIEEKNDYGQNICPYSPATSFACPYGSMERASACCPKYLGKALTESKQAKEPPALPAITYLKKVYYYLGKAIESMEKENNNE